jgi:hypothetical protein
MQKKNKAAFAQTSNTGEHYTPNYILQAAYRVLGGVDLDPSADPLKRVEAKNHYTKADNGLNKPWEGRIFLNPPYGYGVNDWFSKLLYEHSSGNVTDAIVIWKSATETKAWTILTTISEMVCYPDHRVSFEGPPGELRTNTATYSSTIFYIGSNPSLFEECFSPIGQVWTVPESVKMRNKKIFQGSLLKPLVMCPTSEIKV